jgi:hypothetical protein
VTRGKGRIEVGDVYPYLRKAGVMHACRLSKNMQSVRVERWAA